MPKTQTKSVYTIKDSPFFRLRSRKKLAILLRVSPNTLKKLTNETPFYTLRWKHKKLKDGEPDSWLNKEPKDVIADQYRPINIPNPRLKAIQSRIAELLTRIEPPNYLFSPVKGKSYVDNAAYHLGSNVVWSLDVANYFPSCSANNVARFFRRDLECSPDVTAVLVRLVTLKKSLPQGSPCSPILAFFSNYPMWDEIYNVVSAAGCRMSLYVDDITISGPVVHKAMIWQVKKIIHRCGLRLNDKKEFSQTFAPSEITGVIVRGNRMHLPNRKYKILYELKKQRRIITNTNDRKSIENQIAGREAQRRQVERFGIPSST